MNPTAEHAPGPWHVEETPDGSLVVSTAAFRYVAMIAYQDRHGDDAANARLMAVAPLLLAACRAAEELLRDDMERSDDPVCEEVREVYAMLYRALDEALGDPEP